MGKTAVLKVLIISDSKDAQKGLKSTATAAEKFQYGLNKVTPAAAAVTAAGLLMAKTLISAGEAAGTANARIENIAQSMGVFGDQHAQVSKRIIDDNRRMALQTGIDPNVIKQGSAILLTFSEVAKTANDVGSSFDRANQAALDLSAAGFGSVESASTMLGKALQDPTKGMTALTRVGVSFTEQQKQQISALQASGDMLGAQNLILSSVEQQVGGTAKATANATDRMKVGWQLATEALGSALMPALDQTANLIMGLSQWIEENNTVVLILGGTIVGLAAGVLLLNGLIRTWQTIVTVATAAQWLWNAALAAHPIGLVVVAIAAFIAAIVLAYQNVGWFRDGVDAAVSWIIDRWNDLIGVIQGVLGWISSAVDAVGRFLGLSGQASAAAANMPAMSPQSDMGLQAVPMLQAATAPTLSRSTPRLSPAALARPTADTGPTVVNNVYVNTLEDPVATADRIRRLLDDSTRTSGRSASSGGARR